MSPPSRDGHTRPIRVVVADDSHSMRRLLELWLGEGGDLAVAGLAADAEAAVEATERHRPDVVLLDLRLPGVDEPAAVVARLRQVAPEVRVVVLSGLPEGIVAAEAMRAGADHFLTKTASADEVRDAVRAAVRAAQDPAVELDLPRDGQAAALARSRLTDHFEGRLSERRLEDLLMVASELVTNAIVHGDGDVRLRARSHGDRLMVEVADEGSGSLPRVRERTPDEVGGWGLRVVDGLAVRWGAFEGTTHVWAELALDD